MRLQECVCTYDLPRGEIGDLVRCGAIRARGVEVRGIIATRWQTQFVSGMEGGIRGDNFGGGLTIFYLDTRMFSIAVPSPDPHPVP